MKNQEVKKLVRDIAVLTLVVVIAGFFNLLQVRKEGEGTGCVIVMQGQKETGRYPLSVNRTVRIDAPSGGYNLLMIEQGTAQITDADCPDRLCVKQRQISKDREAIICLPHELVITVSSGEESDLDAVTN